jgi:hypothetical protein
VLHITNMHVGLQACWSHWVVDDNPVVFPACLHAHIRTAVICDTNHPYCSMHALCAPSMRPVVSRGPLGTGMVCSVAGRPNHNTTKCRHCAAQPHL